MPIQIRTVIVFGDSLSDIGKKVKENMGAYARRAGKMTVSPTGRFSDCRNWTDFMFEAAGGDSLVVDDAGESIKKSEVYTTLTEESWALGKSDPKSFRYANYAVGGACGDTPHTMTYALGTFKDQVDEFEKDSKKFGELGSTLIIIWFGANDLYTAERPPAQMGAVATVIAGDQRARLLEILKKLNVLEYRFIFVDLARPLTSVRYQMRLEKAKTALINAVQPDMEGYGPLPGNPPPKRYERLGLLGPLVQAARENEWAAAELSALNKQLEEIEGLETGVRLFNATLNKVAAKNGDRVVQMGTWLAEEQIRALVRSNYQHGAQPGNAKHISSQQYDLLKKDKEFATHLTTVDQAHPTDEMYRLIWLKIYEDIQAAGCTFGNLTGVPTQQVGQRFTTESKGAIADEELMAKFAKEGKPLPSFVK